MKRSLIALAALAVVGAASAQSSVTLYGIVDATLAIGNGDTSNLTALGNSGHSGSRLGFKGVEDLGGGMKASFQLEAGLANDAGNGAHSSGALAFNRRSIVSLNGAMGGLHFGRDYSPQFWTHTIYDPFGTNGVGTSQMLIGSLGVAGNSAAVRANNSIGFTSPSMGGFAVFAQTYLGENASNAASQAGDGSAIRLTYDNGPISLAAAFASTTTAGGDVQTTNFGGSYNLGMAQLMGAWNKDAATGAKDVTGYVVGALVPMGNGTVRLAFSNSDNGSGAKTDKFALGYVHDLSKRTAVYGTFASVSNAGGAKSALNGAVTPANGSSTGFDLGVRHNF